VSFSGSNLLSLTAARSQLRLEVGPERSNDVTRFGYADGLCRELGETKDRNDREDEGQSPDEDRTEDCSPYSKAHIEGEVRQHCAHEVASRAVEEQRQENAERSNHEEERYGRHVLLRQTGKKQGWKMPECPGDRHYERRDPRAKSAFKVRKKEASPSQFLAHCASKDL